MLFLPDFENENMGTQLNTIGRLKGTLKRSQISRLTVVHAGIFILVLVLLINLMIVMQT
jgi:hypothetical protein